MNLFEELEIDTSVKDSKKIIELVDQKIKEWSKKTSPKHKAQAPAKLKALRALKADITANPDTVIAEHVAKYAEIIREKRAEFEEKIKEEAVFYIVNGMIDSVSIEKLVSKYNITQKEILKILNVKLKKTYQEDNIVPLEQHIINPINAELDIVNKKDLYDFLGLPRTASQNEITTRESDIRKKNEGNSNKLDPQIGANIRLCGMCSNYLLKDDNRKRYDKALDSVILDDVKEKITIMTSVDKHIRGDKYSMLLSLCLNGGVSQEKAEYYIKKYATDNGATVTEESYQQQSAQQQNTQQQDSQKQQDSQQQAELMFDNCFDDWIKITDLIYSNQGAITGQEFTLFDELFSYWRTHKNLNPPGLEACCNKLLSLISKRDEEDSAYQVLTLYVRLCIYFYTTSDSIYKRFRNLSMSQEKSDKKTQTQNSGTSNSGTNNSGTNNSGTGNSGSDNKSEPWQDKAATFLAIAFLAYAIFSFWTEGFWSGLWSTIIAGVIAAICSVIIFMFNSLMSFLATLTIAAIAICVVQFRSCRDGDEKVERAVENTTAVMVVKTTTYHSISQSRLNIRDAANGSAIVIGTLLYNQEIEVVKINNGFAEIKYGSGVGYVDARYIKEGQSNDAAASAPSTRQSTTSQSSTQQTTARSTTSASNTDASSSTTTQRATQQSTSASKTTTQQSVTTSTAPQSTATSTTQATTVTQEAAPQVAASTTPKAAADYYNDGVNYAKSFKNAEAKTALQKAVDMGSSDAAYYLGMMYVNEGSSSTGFPLVLQAAEAGHKEATFQVAEMYVAGTGTTKDTAQAKVWYLKAEAMGDSRATARLRRL